MEEHKKSKKWAILIASLLLVFVVILLIANKKEYFIEEEIRNEEITNTAVLLQSDDEGKSDEENIQMYHSFLENREYGQYFRYPQQVRYELAYIDEDDMPELLLAEGNGHADRVYVFYYDSNAEEVKFLASFSAFGSMTYVPKGNTIISYYGNHGYYYCAYSEMKDGIVYLKEIFLEAGNLSEAKYYYNFPVPEGFTGGFGKASEEGDIINSFLPVEEEYLITEEEYKGRVEKLQQGKMNIRFDNMKEIYSRANERVENF